MEENINEIIYMVRMGDPNALELLMDAFREDVIHHVRKFCHKNPFMNYDQDDLIQEGMICLYNAVAFYRYDQKASFRMYAYLIFDNRLRNICRHSTTNKEYTNMNVYYLNDIMFGRNTEIIESIPQKDHLAEPEYVLAMNEAYRLLLDTLSDMTERQREAVFQWAAHVRRSAEGDSNTKEYRRNSAMITKVRKMILSELNADLHE